MEIRWQVCSTRPPGIACRLPMIWKAFGCSLA